MSIGAGCRATVSPHSYRRHNWQRTADGHRPRPPQGRERAGDDHHGKTSASPQGRERADHQLPSGNEVSIVDVPGHERFVNNMLAGVGGIDLALLVVAADEAVMPQTRSIWPYWTFST